MRSEEHTSELQSHVNLVCRLLLDSSPTEIYTLSLHDALPICVFGWPEKTPDLEYFFPTQMLSTGPDIIFFWVARMIIAGLEFSEAKPLENKIALNDKIAFKNEIGRAHV